MAGSKVDRTTYSLGTRWEFHADMAFNVYQKEQKCDVVD
jgi:hypothetical protein